MADGFASARSGLARLAAFGTRVQAGEPYRSLADLLRYDEQARDARTSRCASAPTGASAASRSCSMQENAENPFVTSAPRSWLAKVELFVRGYSFGDGEVMARLIDAVFDGIERRARRASCSSLGDVELYLGALGFRDSRARRGPRGVPARARRAATSRASSKRLFNPLLLAHGIKPVPCDARHRSPRHDVLVTGPNSGGKTRLLQVDRPRAAPRAVGPLRPGARGAARARAGARRLAHPRDERRSSRGAPRHGAHAHPRALRASAAGRDGHPRRALLGNEPVRRRGDLRARHPHAHALAPQAFITTHFLAFAARLEHEKKIARLRFLQVGSGRTTSRRTSSRPASRRRRSPGTPPRASA